jgi:ribosomal protein L37AE/L43A
VQLMGIGDDIWADHARRDAEREAWEGDYDGTYCPNCGRQRIMLCANGKRRCEKCNWDPDASQYSNAPTD